MGVGQAKKGKLPRGRMGPQCLQGLCLGSPSFGGKGPILGKVPSLCPSFRSAEDSHSFFFFFKKDLSDYKLLKALLRFPFKGLKGTHKQA